MGFVFVDLAAAYWHQKAECFRQEVPLHHWCNQIKQQLIPKEKDDKLGPQGEPCVTQNTLDHASYLINSQTIPAKTGVHVAIALHPEFAANVRQVDGNGKLHPAS